MRRAWCLVLLCGCGDGGSSSPADATAADATAGADGSSLDARPGADAPPEGTRFGLDWDGTAQVRRMLYWSSPPPAFDATYLFKVYQRDQVTGIGDGSRYYTTFFHGHNGDFVWGSDYHRSYYGAHPYPTPAPSGDGKWEISTGAGDLVDRDDGSSPFVTNDRWYSQAFVAEDLGGGDFRQRFYIDLPSVAAADRITTVASWGAYVEPPSPIICVGQAPDNGAGASWGGYSRWEEQNAVIRGLQIYAAALTEAQILALAALETDDAVLAKNAELGLTSLWYLNMNPRPSDATDKKGTTPHDPVWDGEPAGEWTTP